MAMHKECSEHVVMHSIIEGIWNCRLTRVFVQKRSEKTDGKCIAHLSARVLEAACKCERVVGRSGEGALVVCGTFGAGGASAHGW